MSKAEQKSIINIENHSDLSIRKGETLDSFQFECVFADESRSIRRAQLIHNQETETKCELLMLIRSFVDSGLVSKSDLQSELLRGRAGRKELEIDEATGKVNGSMKLLNKQIVELWNKGKEVSEIATELRGKLKNKRRQNFITKIRRILLRNPKLLLRPYRTEIDFRTERK
jgi:hypothetical protein